MATFKQRRRLGLAALLPALMMLLAINLLSGLSGSRARLDLTENHAFTLSDGTRKILTTLEEPVELRLFLSRDGLRSAPNLGWYAARVEGLLEEYIRRAGGKLSLQVIDPEPFSEQEDRAVAYGLRGVPLERSEAQLYFGLAGESSTGETEVIPFFSEQRRQYLEYDLTRLVHRLSHPDTLVVGLVTALPMEGAALPGVAPRPAWSVLTKARESFTLREISVDGGRIPEDVQVLMLAQPPAWNDAALYAVEQFVLGGGRLLAFVDSASGVQPETSAASSGINKLLEAWGVKLAPDKVAADIDRAMEVNVDRGGRIQRERYPVWLNLTPSEVHPKDIITANLGNLIFATPGYLESVDGATTELTPLVTTTARAAQFDRSAVRAGADPAVMLRTYQPLGRALTLAARISGPVSSVFDGKPADSTVSSPHLAASNGSINVVVVADADFLQDRFWVRIQNIFGARIPLPYASNGTFVVNALENLAGSGDLISVRNRPAHFRPFTLVQRLRSDAELRYRSKEKELLDSLATAEQRLRELEDARGDQSQALIDEQRELEIGNYRAEKVRIRKELRAVRHDLRKDIENLESVVKFVNIGLMPLLIGIGAVLFAAWRRHQRNRWRSRGAGVSTGVRVRDEG